MTNSRWHRPARSAPKSVGAMVHFLMGGGKSADPADVAEQIGVTRRTVRDWLLGRRQPSKKNGAKLRAASEAKYERQARETAKGRKEPYVRGGGAVVPSRLHYNGPIEMLGQTGRNYARPRSISHPMTSEQGARAAAAYTSGDQEGLKGVLLDVLADYFNTGGGYQFDAAELEATLSGADFV